jgi:hypothetical protein
MKQKPECRSLKALADVLEERGERIERASILKKKAITDNYKKYIAEKNKKPDPYKNLKNPRYARDLADFTRTEPEYSAKFYPQVPKTKLSF